MDGAGLQCPSDDADACCDLNRSLSAHFVGKPCYEVAANEASTCKESIRGCKEKSVMIQDLQGQELTSGGTRAAI